MPDPIQTTTVLLGTAASLAIVHTLIGIDHSLPLAALGRARGWALGRTLLVTGVCGAGHVASSVVIGAAGVGLGVATDSLLQIESARGELAAALLIGFGLAYTAWAVWSPRRGHRGRGAATHPNGDIRGVTAWALFVVFVLGPCEPLIPLMAVPGLAGDWLAVTAVAAVFGLLTIGVMLAAVAAAWYGIGWIGRPGVHLGDRLAHATTGLVVAASGAAVLWLSL
jgi:nickel/cobalt exporter